MKKRTWGIRCKWSELERVLLELDRPKGLSLHLLKHDTCPDSSGFGLLSRLGRKQNLDLFMHWKLCANQLLTSDQRRIIDAFQFSCLIIISLIKIRMYCDCHVVVLFMLKNRSIVHHVIDRVLIYWFYQWFANNRCSAVHQTNFQVSLVDWHLNILSQCIGLYPHWQECCT